MLYELNISKIQLFPLFDTFYVELTLLNGHFGWQDDYIAVSVSESMINRVREYIKNQEEHHRNKTFAEEYEELVEKYGFKKHSRK